MKQALTILKKEYKNLKIKWFLFFTLPLFLLTLWYRAAKELARIEARRIAADYLAHGKKQGKS